MGPGLAHCFATKSQSEPPSGILQGLDFWRLIQSHIVRNSLAGDFIWSLTLTDYCTGWTECRATWNKGAAGVVDQIKDIEKKLPFKLRGFDCDNGSEFLNYHLLRYFQEHTNVIQFTRSRPYKKMTMPMLNKRTGLM